MAGREWNSSLFCKHSSAGSARCLLVMKESDTGLYHGQYQHVCSFNTKRRTTLLHFELGVVSDVGFAVSEKKKQNVWMTSLQTNQAMKSTSKMGLLLGQSFMKHQSQNFVSCGEFII